MKTSPLGGARIDRSSGAQGAPKKRRRGLKAAIITLTSLLVIFAAGWIFLSLYVRPPEADGPLDSGQIYSDAANVSPRPEDSGAAVASPVPSGLTFRRGIYSFVVAGQRDGNTDTLMVALLDTENQTLDVISIPRDTLVDCSRKMKKINGAYSAGGQNEKGMERLKTEVATLIGFTPRNYACVNMEGFARLVDAVGGLEFDVPIRMYYPEEGIDLKAGPQKLDGKKALQLVRYRGYGTSASKVGIDHDDYGRMQMQQMFLSALAGETLQAKHIFKVGDFVDIAAKNVLSNLDAGNMLWLAQQCMNLNSEDIHFYTLPTVSVKYAGDARTTGNYYEVVQTKEALELINKTINPYTTPITDDMVTHLTLKNPS